jgi:polyhydroxyalkanoate synthesis repressor PhaR
MRCEGLKTMAKDDGAATAPITIKKYANRRLYNTATSHYVTLTQLATMVKAGVEFVAYEAKTGEDITRSILIQIIVEEESKGPALLPIGFLRQFIRFYGDSLQTVLPRYLEQSMDSFTGNQDQMRVYMETALGGFFPFADFEKTRKCNMDLFESAMKMLKSAPLGSADGAGESGRRAAGAGSKAALSDSQVERLREQLEKMQQQIDELSRDLG